MPETNIKTLSWNINSSPQVDPREAGGPVEPRYEALSEAFSECSVHERFPLITARIDWFLNKGYSTVALQEVNNSILPHIVAHLESKGLEVFCQKYNPDDSSFNHVFAIDPKKYRLIETYPIYLTLSGEPTNNRAELSKEELFKQNLGTAFEKSSQVSIVEDLVSGQRLFFVGNHLGLTNEHRKLAALMLCLKLAHIKDPLILVGDFNQFDSLFKESKLFFEQIDIFVQNGFKWDGESLYQEGPYCTFAGFLYDYERYCTPTDRVELERLKVANDYPGIREFFIRLIIEKAIPLLGTAMDSVFTKNIPPESKSKCKVYMFFDGQRVKPIPENEELEKRLLETLSKGDPPESDHFPVGLKLTF